MAAKHNRDPQSVRPRGVGPRVAVPIHQAVLSDAGAGVHNSRLDEMRNPDTEFRVLPKESAAEI